MVPITADLPSSSSGVAAPSPVLEPNEIKLNIAHWLNSFKVAVDLLRLRSEAASGPLGGGQEVRRMSLCSLALDGNTTKSVFLVHWQETRTLIGQRVRTDNLNRVIVTMPGLRPEDRWCDLRSCEILYPDIGIWMRREKGSGCGE